MIQMHVVKRSGEREPVDFNKITRRLQVQCDEGGLYYADPVVVAQSVIKSLKDGITTAELDRLSVEDAASRIADHPDYGKLAARIAITALHKETDSSFEKVFTDMMLGDMLNPVYIGTVMSLLKNHNIDRYVDHSRDFKFDAFGFSTLQNQYLTKIDGKIIERPQHMYMRIAIALRGDEGMDAVIETYNALSHHWYTVATPTMFNAGMKLQQMSSCFLLDMPEDSIKGIFSSVAECADISKTAGGIGLSISRIRAKGSKIKGTNGVSEGLVPMAKVFNETARYVNQGGRRKGSFALYLEPWHADVFDFLDLKKNHGKEEHRARDLFYALWVPDLFMKRVKEDGMWTLFCPNEVPEIVDKWGLQFEAAYEQAEREGKGRETIPAMKLWKKITDTLIETGMPYILFKDTCNRESNQNFLGYIKSSNLCAEIVEYTDSETTAVCNLASISLPAFVEPVTLWEDASGNNERFVFNFNKFQSAVSIAVKGLDKVIDLNYYPSDKAEQNNKLYRPIGIGVQGLADVFFKMRMPFDSEEARSLNEDIFSSLYEAAVVQSMELAGYQGSRAYKDWEKSKYGKQHGPLRNSLLVALMPTASTSQILGNTECFEPITSNIYVRRTLSGDHVIVNKYLVEDLQSIGLWNKAMKNKIIAANGSIQGIDSIPDDIKALYKTAWEIKQRVIIDLAADRQPYVCQSQSMNLFMAEPTSSKISSALFYGWERGLKTGVYYLRTQPAATPIKFTVEEEEPEPKACRLDDPDCIACSA